MASEQIADIGYLAVKKETTKGTAVTPNVYLPFFSDTLATSNNIEDIDPIVGLKAMRLSTQRGQRDHKGEIVFLGEPNTAGYILDMFLNKVSTSGGSPYTHTFRGNTTNPNSYTVDVARGRSVHRYWGLEAREFEITFDNNRAKFNVGVSALGAFTGAKITNVSTNTLTISSEYDATPTKGLVTSDLVRIFLANGNVVDTTISSLAATTITVASAGAASTGDFITLRPATPTVTLVDYLTWARTEFRFGDTASAALSATQTQVEAGSGYKFMHKLLPDEGAKRSGSFDPVSLIRGRTDVELKTKIFFDTPDEQSRFREQSKRACVVRSFAGANNASTYELRATLNNLVVDGNPVNSEVGGVLFNDMTFKSRYDSSDAQMFDIVVINGVASI